MEPGARCLSDDALALLVDRELPEAEAAEAHAHLSDCAECRTVFADLLRGDDTEPSPGPAAPWEPPGEFDEFQVERKLPQGSFGLVYLARDTSLERRVVLKFIASDDPEQGGLVETEARALARLQHPNVVSVYKMGSLDGRPYLVCEYVEGQTLADLAGPLPWRRVLNIALGLSRGLAAAHGEGLVHRDIKPSNVIVTPDDQVKLLDFGLAVRTRAPAQRSGEGGTPLYMAPELFAGAKASTRSDLYSLGLVLAELLTGERPFRRWGRTPEEGLAAAARGADPDFLDHVERCLEADPARRPASADALAEALRRLSEAFPSGDRLPPGNPYRGLAPFEEEHQTTFLGRGDDIRAVAERLAREPAVLIAGDSGVGKSSLCRAGVLPFLAAQAAASGHPLAGITLVPGRRPLQSLAVAVASRLGRPEGAVLQALHRSPVDAARALRESAAADPGGLVLFVDQLEELKTLAEPAHAERFATFLGELALPASRVRVLLAVRGDYLTRISALPRLGGVVRGAFHLLLHLSPDGVREAVVGPARSRGVVFESRELIQELVQSAEGPGSLPLLQFALAELWDRRDQGRQRITRAALVEMGGVAGALSRHADRVLKVLDKRQVEAARQLLLQLVTAQETRMERAEEELAPASNPRRREALRALVEGRLVQVRAEGGRVTYQVAHDALIAGWATLRSWLDENRGLMPTRRKLEAAVEEWVRVRREERAAGRRRRVVGLGPVPGRDALASPRLLAEVSRLDPESLLPRQRLYIERSRLAERRRRQVRWLAFLAPAVAAVAMAVGLLLYIAWQSVKAADALTAEADRKLALARREAARAGERRDDAMALFDGRAPAGGPASPGDLWQAAEDRWSESLESLDRSRAAYAEADELLKRALQRFSGHVLARRTQVSLLQERIRLAEGFYQPAVADAARLEQLAAQDSSLEPFLSAPATLDLEVDPPSAEVEVLRVESDGAVRREVPAPDVAPAPLSPPLRALALPAGSYVLRLRHPDRAAVDLPLRLTRGGRAAVKVPLPRAVPAGYAYVPPGCTLSGTAAVEEMRALLNSAPLHEVCLDRGFFIGRTEVTWGDWLEYLDEQPAGSGLLRRLEQPRYNAGGIAVTLQHRAREGWVFSFLRQESPPLRAAAGQALRFPERSRNAEVDWTRLPLLGVSAADVEGYHFWLSRTGRLPGARFCTEQEWERAARGADDRPYPHGDRLAPDDADLDATYGRRPGTMGPDEVGRHPRSASPFGVQDLAGNAFELVRPARESLGRFVLRGGAWYYDRTAALIANRQSADPALRDPTVGVRVCADVTPP